MEVVFTKTEATRIVSNILFCTVSELHVFGECNVRIPVKEYGKQTLSNDIECYWYDEQFIDV